MIPLGWLAAVALSVLPADPPLPTDIFAQTSIPASLPVDVFAPSPGDDVLDVVVFGSSRVVLMRFHVRIDGKGYRSSWYESMIRLYHYLDRNDDGILTASEAGRVPWTSILSGPFNGRGQIQRPARIDANNDGKVSFDEFTTYIRISWDIDVLTTQSGPAPDARTDAVFRLLDRDGDGEVSDAELATTDARLATLDRDEDELLDQNEMNPDRTQSPFQFGQRNNGAVDRSVMGAVALTSSDFRAAMAVRIMRAYGKGNDNKTATRLLGPDVLAIDPSAFRAADKNGDGWLNLDELKAFLDAARPALEYTLNLGGEHQATGGKLEPVPPSTRSGRSRNEPTSRRNDTGALIAEFDETEIDFTTTDTSQSFQPFLIQQFKSADTDKNGYVDLKESRANGFISQFFLVVDRNEDGRMTEAELNEYAERGRDVSDSRMSLTVTDRGADLFNKLDANRDNQLSIRELRSARDRFKPMDRNHDGLLVPTELPKRIDLSLGRGASQNQQFVMPQAMGMTSTSERRTQVIPSWFKGMDRNGDGDVSAREFLGPAATFRQLDRDGDGLIDASEAARAAEF